MPAVGIRERRSTGRFPLVPARNYFPRSRLPAAYNRVAVDRAETNTWLVRQILVHEKHLRGYVQRFFTERCDVEDIVQETYAHLLALPLASRAAVRDWRRFLFTTARNLTFDRLRKRRVVSLDAIVEIDSCYVIDDRPSACEDLNTRQELALLSVALASLPQRCRQVLTLRKIFGLPQREIAERLGIAEKTVESHVANGVRLCAQQLFALLEGAPKAAQEPARSAEKQGRSDDK